jgi:hypothetical protein
MCYRSGPRGSGMMADEADIIHDVGHRNFVGGNDGYCESISKLQFERLVSEGLKSSDVLVDIGCGSLRGGRRFIAYLERGHYIGIDKNIELIIYGVGKEVGFDLSQERRPRFIITVRYG